KSLGNQALMIDNQVFLSDAPLNRGQARIRKLAALMDIPQRINLWHALKCVKQMQPGRAWVVGCQDFGEQSGGAALVYTALPKVAGHGKSLPGEREEHIAAIRGHKCGGLGALPDGPKRSVAKPGRKERCVECRVGDVVL